MPTPELVPPKRPRTVPEEVTVSIEAQLGGLMEKYPELPRVAVDMRKEQIQWMRGKRSERDQLFSSCTRIIKEAAAKGIAEDKLKLIHSEAQQRLDDWDEMFGEEFGAFVDKQTDKLRAEGLSLLKPSPLDKEDFEYNKSIIRTLIINYM